MSLFGSLFTGVSALNAQSQSLTIISNNISNNQTPGYKRTIASFANLVTGFDSESVLQPGGTKAIAVSTVDQQGLLAQTSSSTDLGILGEGMFVVGANENDTIQYPFYTRAGQFQENQNGYLENPQGYILYGWQLDSNGDVPADFDNLGALEPINLNFLPGFNEATSEIDASINLDSSQPIDVNTSPSADFTRVVTVYDSLGVAQNVTLTVSKVPAPNLEYQTTDVTGLTLETELNPSGAAVAADTLTVNGQVVNIGPLALGQSYTVGELINDINAQLANSVPSAANDAQVTLTSDGTIAFIASNPGDALTVSGSAAANSILSAIDSQLGTGGGLAPANAVVPAASSPYAAATGFPSLLTAENAANPLGWWQFSLAGGDHSGASADVGFINFAADGTVNAQPNIDGHVSITMSGIDFGNGSSSQNIDFNLENFSQLDSTFVTTSVEQDGTSFGVRSGVSVDTDGNVNVTFSNGRVVPIYRVALADFPNVNGLQEQSLNVYSQSNDSGDPSLREPSVDGAGQVFSNSYEQSNVDLADEFSRLIITQRAYSAGTKVISTADQMLTELLNIR